MIWIWVSKIMNAIITWTRTRTCKNFQNWNLNSRNFYLGKPELAKKFQFKKWNFLKRFVLYCEIPFKRAPPAGHLFRKKRNFWKKLSRFRKILLEYAKEEVKYWVYRGILQRVKRTSKNLGLKAWTREPKLRTCEMSELEHVLELTRLNSNSQKMFASSHLCFKE